MKKNHQHHQSRAEKEFRMEDKPPFSLVTKAHNQQTNFEQGPSLDEDIAKTAKTKNKTTHTHTHTHTHFWNSLDGQP
jgi:hypothetical protein